VLRRPSSFSQTYSGSMFAGVILTFVTIITIMLLVIYVTYETGLLDREKKWKMMQEERFWWWKTSSGWANDDQEQGLIKAYLFLFRSSIKPTTLYLNRFFMAFTRVKSNQFFRHHHDH
jgi:hypothetical protein